MLVVAPLLFIAGAYDVPFIYAALGYAFVGCWAVFAVSWVVFAIGLAGGKYRRLEPRTWKDQVW